MGVPAFWRRIGSMIYSSRKVDHESGVRRLSYVCLVHIFVARGYRHVVINVGP